MDTGVGMLDMVRMGILHHKLHRFGAMALLSSTYDLEDVTTKDLDQPRGGKAPDNRL